MELIKEGSSAEISDNPATVTAKSAGLFGKFGKREGINEQEQSQLIDAWQSNTDVTRRLLFISVVIGTIAFLTAITALVLPLVMMKSHAFNTSSTFPTDHGALQRVSELEKNMQEMKRNLSALLEYSVKNTRCSTSVIGPPGVNGTNGGPAGPPGPPGYNGTQGPSGPGASSCVFKTLSSPGMIANSIAHQEITATEPNGKIFIGVNCDTNDAKLSKLSSAISGGMRTYKCSCEGTLTTGEATMYCYMHYWECQM